MPYTMEADIDHGRIIPKEPEKLPPTGKALITVLEPAPKKPDWKVIEKAIAKLRPAFKGVDGVAYQRKERAEWDERERKQWRNWRKR